MMTRVTTGAETILMAEEAPEGAHQASNIVRLRAAHLAARRVDRQDHRAAPRLDHQSFRAVQSMQHQEPQSLRAVLPPDLRSLRVDLPMRQMWRRRVGAAYALTLRT